MDCFVASLLAMTVSNRILLAMTVYNWLFEIRIATLQMAGAAVSVPSPLVGEG